MLFSIVFIPELISKHATHMNYALKITFNWIKY